MPRQLTITIDLDNAAFGSEEAINHDDFHQEHAEIALILGRMIGTVHEQNRDLAADPLPLRDTNGNTVGYARIEVTV